MRKYNFDTCLSCQLPSASNILWENEKEFGMRKFAQGSIFGEEYKSR